jgi:hypothetical protein
MPPEKSKQIGERSGRMSRKIFIIKLSMKVQEPSIRVF